LPRCLKTTMLCPQHCRRTQGIYHDTKK
jgi:hypothetical protein